MADLERDLVVERARRAAAEQLAADRAEHITDLRRSLLMLEASRSVQEVDITSHEGAALTLVADPQPTPQGRVNPRLAPTSAHHSVGLRVLSFGRTVS